MSQSSEKIKIQSYDGSSPAWSPRWSSRSNSLISCNSSAEKFLPHDSPVGSVVHCSDEKSDTKERSPESDNSSDGVGEVLKLAQGLNVPQDVLEYVPPKEFEIEIPSHDVNLIFDFAMQKFKKGQWADVISDHITDKQKVCSFQASRAPQYNKVGGKSAFCIFRGHCHCQIKFTVRVELPPKIGEMMICNVKSTGNFKLIQTKATGRKICGIKRENLSKLLSHQKPGKIYQLNKRQNSILKTLHNNNPQMSIKVLQKIRYEAKHSQQKHSDPFEDIKLFEKECIDEEKSSIIPGFVQYYKFKKGEINIKLYTESSLRLLLTCHTTSDFVMHFDATGSFLTETYGKRLLYYLAVIRTNTGYTFPLASMISQTGKATDIALLFLDIKRDIKKIQPNYNKHLVSVGVVDFSITMMSSLCMGLNTQTVKDYIRDSYYILQEKDVLDKERSVIFVCTAHVVKSFRNLLGRHIKRKKIKLPERSTEIRHVALKLFAKILSSRDLSEFTRTCNMFCEIFCNKFVPEDQMNLHLAWLNFDDDENEAEVDDVGLDIDFDSIFPSTEHAQLREKSQFFQLFKIIREKSTHGEKDGLENEIYDPAIVDLLQNYYIQYSPFFCSMMLYATSRSGESRYSNSLGESEFNFVKNIYGGHERTSLNIFVRNNYDYHVGRVREVLTTATKGKRGTKTKLKRLQRKSENLKIRKIAESAVGDGEKSEVWCRRKKSSQKPKYVGPRVRHKIHDSSKSQNKVREYFLAEAKRVLEKDLSQNESQNVGDTTSKVQSKNNEINITTLDELEVSSAFNQSTHTDLDNLKSTEYNEKPEQQSSNQKKLKDFQKNRDEFKKQNPLLPERTIFETEGGLIIIDNKEHNKNISRMIKMDEEIEHDMETMVEIENMFKYCEKILGPLNDNNSVKSLSNGEDSEEQLKCPTNQAFEVQHKNPKDDLMLETCNEAVTTIGNLCSKKVTAPCNISGAKIEYLPAKLVKFKDEFLDSRQLLQLANPKEWIETEVIDLYIKLLKEKTNSPITITRSSYASLVSLEKNQWSRARQSGVVLDGDLTLLDVQNQSKHLHPLFWCNHWLLLELDTARNECTIFDSMMIERESNNIGTLENDRKLIKEFILPEFFLDSTKISGWQIKHYGNMPQQNDLISCGLYVLTAAHDRITRHDGVVQGITSKSNKRMELVRELLETTESGKQLLKLAGQDNEKLYNLIHTDASKAEDSTNKFYKGSLRN